MRPPMTTSVKHRCHRPDRNFTELPPPLDVDATIAAEHKTCRPYTSPW